MNARRQSPGIRGPAVATPGTSVPVEVDGPGSVVMTQPGGPMTQLPVRDGRALVPIPANAVVGSQVHVIVLGRVPPLGLSIIVVAK